MGNWNAGINGNDTAQSLKPEYQAAFFYNDVETALKKIEEFVREDFDESDEGEWCDYCYSLADFMWKHGILTENIKRRVLEMIDSEFGLGIWREEGIGALNKRRKIIAEFREMLLSPQPPEKKIRFNLHKKPIFNTGDIIALRLINLENHVREYARSTDQDFVSYNNKYIVLRKVGDSVNQYSYIEPQLKDYWAVFQLYNRIFDMPPAEEQLKNIAFVPTRDGTVFISESSLFHLKKRGYYVIGNNQEKLPQTIKCDLSFVLWGTGAQWGEPDFKILNAILNGVVLH